MAFWFLGCIFYSRSPIVPQDRQARCVKGDHLAFKCSEFSLGISVKIYLGMRGRGGRARGVHRHQARGPALATNETNTAAGNTDDLMKT